jgi:2-oxoglutarate ferredoxin oxidoreductase subunit delta
MRSDPIAEGKRLMLKTRKKKKPDLVGRVENDERNGVELPIVIFRNWCKGCGICVEFCPQGVLALDAEIEKAIVVNPEKCTLCGVCELRCPDFAIARAKKKQRKNVGGEDCAENN